eukprot:tig00000073_g1682.t1
MLPFAFFPVRVQRPQAALISPLVPRATESSKRRLRHLESGALGLGSSKSVCGFCAEDGDGEVPAAAAVRAITVAGVRYSVKRILGEGGFAYVALAEDPEGQQRAVKMILCQSEEQIKEAEWEIEVHRRVMDVPRICRMLACGREAAPHIHPSAVSYYLVLPYYESGSLQGVLDSLRRRGSHLEEPEALRIFGGLLEAAEGLHARGLCHRDIKPLNILLDGEGAPLLIDLGSASPTPITVENRLQALEVQERAAVITSAGYRAPELFDVPSRCTVDERVDVWSLGCTLFAMAYGASPFELATAKGGSFAMAVLNPPQFPESPPTSEAFKGLVRAALEVDAQRRPRLSDLQRLLAPLLAAASKQPRQLLPPAPAANRL